MRGRRWKCLVNAGGTDVQLYEFSKSQDDRNNPAPDHPEVAQEMVRQPPRLAQAPARS